jgi:hypothetical protein
VAGVPAALVLNEGETEATVSVQAGVAGSTVVTASSPGFNAASATVDVVAPPALSFEPGSVVAGLGRTVDVGVRLEQPAPSGGLDVTLQSSDAGVATAPATLTFLEGTSEQSVAVSGVSLGNAVLTASAPGYAQANLAVSVRTLAIGLPPETLVGPGLSVSVPVTLSDPAPVGGLIVVLDIDDTDVAATTSQLVLQQGDTSGTINLTGRSPGTATFTASAPGYTAGAGTILVETVEIRFDPTGDLNTYEGRSERRSVPTSRIAPQGGWVVALETTDPSIASVSPATVTIPQGQSSGGLIDAIIVGVSTGSVVVSAQAPGLVGDSLAVTVNPTPGIRFNDQLARTYLVGEHLISDSNSAYIRLGAPAPARGVTANLRISDINHVQLAANGSLQSAEQIDLSISEGQNFAYFRLIGVQETTSNVVLSVNAPGYLSATAECEVRPPILDISRNDGDYFIRDTTSVSVFSAVRSASGTLTYQRAAADTTVNLTRSDPAVATIDSPVSIVADSSSSSSAIMTAAGPGPAVIQASAIGFQPDPADRFTATVNAPGMVFNDNASIRFQIGEGLQSPNTTHYIRLQSVAPAGGVPVTLTSSDPTLFQLSAAATNPPQPSVTVTVPAGSNFAYFHIAGIQERPDPGTLTAEASGYAPGSAEVEIQPSALQIAFSPLSYFVGQTRGNIYVYSALLNDAGSFAGYQPVTAATTVNLSNSNPLVGDFPTTAAIPAASTIGEALTFRALAPGMITIQAMSSGFTSHAGDQVTVTVLAPGMRFNDTTRLTYLTGRDMGSALSSHYIRLQSPAPTGGVSVVLSVADPTVALVATNGGSIGAESVTLPIAEGANFSYFRLIGVATSDIPVAVSATADGYATETASVIVRPPQLRIFSLSTTLFAGVQSTRGGVASFITQTNGSFVGDLPVLTDVTVERTSSNPSVGTISSPVTIPANANQSETLVFEALSPGSTTVRATASRCTPTI